MDVLIAGKRVRLTSTKIIASGGEAEIYDIGHARVAKVFKTAGHSDFAQDPIALKRATERILEHQHKLLAWPTSLPSEVIGPIDLIYDLAGKKILGYTMRFVADSEVLLKYSERKYRESRNIDANQTVEVFRSLVKLVTLIHQKGVVIGDFNDLNVLVGKAGQIHLVDADSMQFGKYKSRLFTARFVDPLVCDLRLPHLELSKEHTSQTDWYAYSIMLMQSLLYVGPYGGIHTPPPGILRLKETDRIKNRLTIFDTNIRYPKPALHYSLLPDTLLDHFQGVFARDERPIVTEDLLSGVVFRTCLSCGALHARSVCPSCTIPSLVRVKEIHSGSVEATKILDTSGRILHTTFQGGTLYFVYHENGAYYREDRQKILDGPIDPDLRIRVCGRQTILAREGKVVILTPGTAPVQIMSDLFRGRTTMVDASESGILFLQGGQLQRRVEQLDSVYSESLGSLIEGQTLFWLSDTLGMTFARAGGVIDASVFDPRGKTLGTSVSIPPIAGQILDAVAVFSDQAVWFLYTAEYQGQRINFVRVYDRYGVLLGTHQTESGDGSWLSSIRGKCASRKQIFSPTDQGIVRTEIGPNQTLETTREFSGTDRFVDSATKLLCGKDGMYAVETSRIWRLRIK